MPHETHKTEAPPDALRHLTDEQTERLSAVLDDYLARLESGDAPRPDQLLAQHPDIRDTLQMYLGKLGELHNFAAGFSPHLAGTDLAAPPLAGADRSIDSGHLPNDTSPAFGDSTQGPPPLVEPTPPASISTKVLSGDALPDEEAPDGRRLDDFQLLRVIGRGGMGIVYEAQQISLKRRVAVKLLPLISVLDARQITRFKNEAQAAASLQHPNIVPIYAVGNHRGVHYYAMRFIDGHALDAIITTLRHVRDAQTSNASKSDQAEQLSDAPTMAQAASQAIDESVIHEGQWSAPPAYQRVVKLGIQAATALAAAHEEGIIHRDIKPSNLMVDKQNKLWITDFGLARRASDQTLTATGDLVGTLRYMSPEQARGQTALVDGRSDVYSLGATLYELLTLQPAIAGDNSPTMLRAIETQKPTALRVLRPDIPRDLATVIEKAMSKVREDRYVTAQELADDLTRVLEGRPTLAQPPSLLTRGVKWVQRNPSTARLAAFISLVSLLFVSAGTSIVVNSVLKAANDQRRYAQQSQLLENVEQQVLQLEKEAALIPGTQALRTRMIDQLLRLYGDFATEQQKQALRSPELATALIEIGLLNNKLAKYAQAENSLKQAEELARQLAVARPRELLPRRELARATHGLALVLQGQQNLREASRLANEAVRLQKELMELHPDNPALQLDWAQFSNTLALLQIKLGDSQNARLNLENQVQRLEASLPGFNGEDQLQGQLILAAAYTNLAHVVDAGNLRATYHNKALQYNLEVARKTNNAVLDSELAVNYSNLGKAYSDEGQIEQAAGAYTAAVDISELLVKVDPNNDHFLGTLAEGLNNLGMAELKLAQQDRPARSARLDKAIAHLARAIELELKLTQRRPDDPQLHHELGGMYNNLAKAQEAAGQSEHVEASFLQAIEHQTRALKAAPEVPEYRNFQDTHLLNYWKWLVGQGRFDTAFEIVAQQRQLWPASHPKQVALARNLALQALELARQDQPVAVTRQFAALAQETISLARDAGLSVQSIVTEEPFLSLSNLKSLTDRARP